MAAHARPAGSRTAHTIVAIDLRRLRTCRIHDISTDEGKLAHGIRKGTTEWRFCSDTAEVAIAGDIPREAIIGTLDALQLRIPHRQTATQTIAEFKATTSAAARWKLRDWAMHTCTQRHAAQGAPTKPPSPR